MELYKIKNVLQIKINKNNMNRKDFFLKSMLGTSILISGNAFSKVIDNDIEELSAFGK